MTSKRLVLLLMVVSNTIQEVKMYPTVKELHKRKDALREMESALLKDKENINSSIETINIELEGINKLLKLHEVTK
tara:strand:+ start:252 stop:479 length:228 start_codon:yes stop_codon:yes gene_type:complete